MAVCSLRSSVLLVLSIGSEQSCVLGVVPAVPINRLSPAIATSSNDIRGLIGAGSSEKLGSLRLPCYKMSPNLMRG